jgi:hypothetical protein
MLVTICGCTSKVDTRVSLWRNDKIPYGTYYAYKNLGHIFRDADIETSNKSPLSLYGLNESSSAYIIIGNSIRPDERELQSIINYANNGNQVFISALNIGENILDSFKLAASNSGNVYNQIDSLTVSILDPVFYDSLSFTYPGRALDNYFTSMDSSITYILGKDIEGNANFVKFSYNGGGAVFIHLAPAAFTNFFLLHKQNKRYYDLAMSSMPDTLTKVRWDDYFRHHTNGDNNAEKSAFSMLGVFLNNEVLRWAFWLTLLLFSIIYLFESKRKQRIVPVVKPLSNTSLDFVKTIGRLYYQRKDNKNLASKMSTHFLGHVRLRYTLQTSTLDEEFEKKLAYKSGYSIQLVKDIVQYIRDIEKQDELSDEDLLSFNDKIDKFYKHT